MKNNVSAESISKTLKSPPTICIVQVRDVNGESPAAAETAQISSYWSWTFGIISFPFLLWGCPFYLVTRQPSKTFPLRLITSTSGWLKRMFECCTSPLISVLTFLLIFPTISINAYVFYIFGDMFNHLFVSGTYELSMFDDLLGLIRYLPVLVPLDYIWLRGFRVNNMIILLNSVHGRYGGVGCSTVRFRLILMLFAIFGVHVIRYFCYERYEIADGKTVLEAIQNMLEFSVDLFCSLLLPLYCAFCYAIRFQLFAVKALVYRLVAQKVVPAVTHLDMVKILYTQAADQIELTNGLFSLYLSAALIIMFIGTIFDAENLWKALLKLYGGTQGQFGALLAILAREVTAAIQNGTTTEDGRGEEQTMEDGTVPAIEFTAQDIREINADIACILITYTLMFFTIWQAVGTNDFAREVHVWLNDFVTGAGGTDVRSVLQDLGVHDVRGNGSRSSNDDEPVLLVDHRDEEDGGLVWARDSMQDEFLAKFKMLKAYMHVRMQVEKPALLNITLVGILVPSLSGRLRNYRLLF